jgi:hypothetical protein
MSTADVLELITTAEHTVTALGQALAQLRASYARSIEGTIAPTPGAEKRASNGGRPCQRCGSTTDLLPLPYRRYYAVCRQCWYMEVAPSNGRGGRA